MRGWGEPGRARESRSLGALWPGWTPTLRVRIAAPDACMTQAASWKQIAGHSRENHGHVYHRPGTAAARGVDGAHVHAPLSRPTASTGLASVILAVVGFALLGNAPGTDVSGQAMIT